MSVQNCSLLKSLKFLPTKCQIDTPLRWGDLSHNVQIVHV